MKRVHDWMARPGRAALLLLLVLAGAPAAEAQLSELRTEAEELAFSSHTSYAAMETYLGALQAGSLDMRLGTYGQTREGRTLHYAVFGRPLPARPHEAIASGKPVLLLAANVHGGERTPRESLLILMREMAERGTPANRMLDDLIIVVAPTINPDGLEASPRPTRGNAWGIDLNRDYARLDHPEIRDYLGNLVQAWQPHVLVDGHNGGRPPYNLMYQCGGHGGGDQRLTHICHDEIFPAIDRRLEGAGYLSFHYGTPRPDGWHTATALPRMGSDYAAMANIIGILFESPGGQGMATGVDAAGYAFRAVLEYTRDHAQEVMDLVADARRETVRLGIQGEGDIVIRQQFVAAERPVDYKITEGSGADQRIVEVPGAPLIIRPEATRTRERPFAYILPRDAVDAVALLRRHDILVEVTREPVEVEVQAYTLDAIDYRAQFNHASTPEVTVGGVVTLTRSFPAGSYVVPTGQVMGRLVTHFLEPETEDNVVVWNTMNPWLPMAELARWRAATEAAQEEGTSALEPPLVPIYKLMRATPLPTRILEGGWRSGASGK